MVVSYPVEQGIREGLYKISDKLPIKVDHELGNEPYVYIYAKEEINYLESKNFVEIGGDSEHSLTSALLKTNASKSCTFNKNPFDLKKEKEHFDDEYVNLGSQTNKIPLDSEGYYSQRICRMGDKKKEKKANYSEPDGFKLKMVLYLINENLKDKSKASMKAKIQNFLEKKFDADHNIKKIIIFVDLKAIIERNTFLQNNQGMENCGTQIKENMLSMNELEDILFPFHFEYDFEHLFLIHYKVVSKISDLIHGYYNQVEDLRVSKYFHLTKKKQFKKERERGTKHNKWNRVSIPSITPENDNEQELNMINTLSEIPRISEIAGQKIIKLYPSIKALYRKYLNEMGITDEIIQKEKTFDLKSVSSEKINNCKTLLADIKLYNHLGRSKNANLGKKKSERIFNIFFEKNGKKII